MLRSRPSVVGKLGVVGLLCGAMVVAASSGCGGSSGDPFTYKKISGKVTYDDGSLIPATRLELKFSQVNPQPVGNMYPRPGTADVKVDDGTFESVTSSPQNVGGGLVPGKYKVTLVTQEKNEKPRGLVPPEYLDFAKTPLVIDTNDSPLAITVKKPANLPK
jgi:hypothetical protein